MPALRLFGRNWSLASDDIPLLAAPAAVFHCLWCIFMLVGVGLLAHHYPTNCPAGIKYMVCLCGLALCFLASTILEAWLTREGLKGTILETQRRSKVPKLLYAQIAIFLLEVAFVIFGTIVLYGYTQPTCFHTQRNSYNPHRIMMVMIWTSWAALVVVGACTILTYNFFPTSNSQMSWELRCKCLACILCFSDRATSNKGPHGGSHPKEDQASPISRMAELFAQVFGEWDMVTTDVLATFLMAAAAQRCKRRRVVQELVSQHLKPGAGSLLQQAASTTGSASHSVGGLMSDLVHHVEDDFDRRLHPIDSINSQQGLLTTGSDSSTAVAEPPNMMWFWGGGRELDPIDGLTSDQGQAGQKGPASNSPPKSVDSTPSGLGPQAPDSSSPLQHSGSGRSKESPQRSDQQQMEDRGGAAGVVGGERGGDSRRSRQPQHLLTPSGMMCELNPGMDPHEAAEAQGRHHKAVSTADLLEAAHYVNFAFASYGYMLYIWSKPPVSGPLQLCFGRCCSCWLHPLRRYQEIFSTEAWSSAIKVTNHMNREAIHQMTGLPDRAVVFVRFEGEARNKQCLPYFIAVDERSKAVVLSIRGTLSLEDCITDFLCEPAVLDDWIKEVGNSGASGASFEECAPPVQKADRDAQTFGHSGILEAAKAVVEDLQQTGVLGGLMKGQQVHSRHKKPAFDCRGWRLVVTGHSLGAGAAVLVALYLRNFFPRVKCWAFSPPGGLADRNVSRAAQEFCTSVFLGKDWIPRLTVNSFERLRDEMIMAATRIKISKLRFLVGAFRGKQWEEDELFLPEDSVRDEAAETLRRYHATIKRTRTDRNRYHMSRQFVPPGRLMHLRPVKAKCKEKKLERRYHAVWIEAGELQAEGILVSPRIMADHMPDYVTETLQRMAREAALREDLRRTSNGAFVLDVPPSPQGEPVQPNAEWPAPPTPQRHGPSFSIFHKVHSGNKLH
eukprot:jgi/Astpho2/9487/fgenesh1_pg.00145_%23_78_t